MATSTRTVKFSDDFNRANGSLGTNWPIKGNITIVSNQASSTGLSGAIAAQVMDSVDQYAQIVYKSGTRITLILRNDGNTTSGFWIDFLSDGTWYAFDFGGTWYGYSQGYSGDPADYPDLPHALQSGDVMAIEAIGKKLNVYQNSVLVAAIALPDTQPANTVSYNRVGFRLSAAGTADNFEAGIMAQANKGGGGVSSPAPGAGAGGGGGKGQGGGKSQGGGKGQTGQGGGTSNQVPTVHTFLAHSTMGLFRGR